MPRKTLSCLDGMQSHGDRLPSRATSPLAVCARSSARSRAVYGDRHRRDSASIALGQGSPHLGCPHRARTSRQDPHSRSAISTPQLPMRADDGSRSSGGCRRSAGTASTARTRQSRHADFDRRHEPIDADAAACLEAGCRARSRRRSARAPSADHGHDCSNGTERPRTEIGLRDSRRDHASREAVHDSLRSPGELTSRRAAEFDGAPRVTSAHRRTRSRRRTRSTAPKYDARAREFWRPRRLVRRTAIDAAVTLRGDETRWNSGSAASARSIAAEPRGAGAQSSRSAGVSTSSAASGMSTSVSVALPRSSARAPSSPRRALNARQWRRGSTAGTPVRPS